MSEVKPFRFNIDKIVSNVLIVIVISFLAGAAVHTAFGLGYDRGMRDIALGASECAVFVLNDEPRAVCEKKKDGDAGKPSSAQSNPTGMSTEELAEQIAP